MAYLTEVSITSGVPTSGTGEVFTINKLMETRGVSAEATFTCGTTAYAALDAVGAGSSAAALTFTSMGVAGEFVRIKRAYLRIDTTAIISGETSYKLAMYNATPPGAINDSAAWDLPSGDRAAFLGFIDLGSPADLGSTLWVEVDNVMKDLKMGASTSLFAYLLTNGAYTPTARVFTIGLVGEKI